MHHKHTFIHSSHRHPSSPLYQAFLQDFGGAADLQCAARSWHSSQAPGCDIEVPITPALSSPLSSPPRALFPSTLPFIQSPDSGLAGAKQDTAGPRGSSQAWIAHSTASRNPEALTLRQCLGPRPPGEGGTAGGAGGAEARAEEVPPCPQRPRLVGPELDGCQAPAEHPSSEAQPIPPLRSASLSASLPKRSSISAIAAHVRCCLSWGGSAPGFTAQNPRSATESQRLTRRTPFLLWARFRVRPVGKLRPFRQFLFLRAGQSAASQFWTPLESAVIGALRWEASDWVPPVTQADLKRSLMCWPAEAQICGSQNSLNLLKVQDPKDVFVYVGYGYIRNWRYF
jgi:hypothetical protein